MPIRSDAGTRRYNIAPTEEVLAILAAQLAWLSSDLDAQDALVLCGAVPAARLSARPANPALNRAGAVDEGPELLVLPA